MRRDRGVSAVELLAMVLVFLILGAIVSSLREESEIRKSVVRVKGDMRAMATALEAYAVDNHANILSHPFGIAGSELGWDPTNPAPTTQTAGILEHLSTPVAYMTSAIIRDPFTIKYRYSAPTATSLAFSTKVPVTSSDPAVRLNSFIYQSWNDRGLARVPSSSQGPAQAWLLHSAGPDNAYHNLGGVLAIDFTIDGPILLMYDPTNGTISFGSIYRTGGAIYDQGSGGYAAGAGLQQAILKTQ